MRLDILLLAVAVACLTFDGAAAFKEQDFKKCNDASFCARNRGKSGAKFVVKEDAVAVSGDTLTATLVNVDSQKTFNLSLIAYGDYVRVLVDELPGVGRYQVPDVLMPDLETKRQAWQAKATSAKSMTLATGSSQATLEYNPFRIVVLVNDKPAVTLNSRDMFNFEHRREKQEGDPEGWWDESFNSHSDTKPKGPEAISLDIAFPKFEHVYGIPEHATNLLLKPTVGVSEPYRMYNLDVFQYLDNSPFGLYGSIPVMIAHQVGLTVAVFWLNAAEMFIDVEKKRDGIHTQWVTESGIVDLFILAGPTPAKVMQQYAAISGPTAMPQLFSIGYHQCRWNYKDQEDVRQVDAGFDQHAIPYDVIWLDIEHTNGKRYMTWDHSLFPNPEQMQNDVASRGRKMVTIVDPHVKRDSTYTTHSEAERLKYYVKNRDNQDFDGWCWPGSSSYLDVSNPEVRGWWAQQFLLDSYKGSTANLYIWNDMNEPSVFNGPEITMPKDNLHWNNVEHRDLHNLYGLYYHMATADGLALRGRALNGPDGDRPFVLSRAFFSGTQRVGPIWTGDNGADWQHLKVSVPMLLTLGITGLPFSGADVGGFFGNPDAELMTRWYQVGQYYPFFRGHAHLDTARREPWLFGEPTTSHIRDAIRGRYALLPYLYTLFREANTTGQPIMRPLWFEFPDSKDTFAEEEEFMLGPGILVRPVLTQGASTVEAFLPRASRWYDGLTGAAMVKSTWLPGLDQMHKIPVTMDGIPFFYRGGSIIPRRERPRRSTAAMARDPFTLVVSLDHNGTAEGSLYLDDGRSYAFIRGLYLHRRFSFQDNTLSNRKLQQEGVPEQTLQSDLQVERIVVLGLPKKDYTVTATVGGQQRVLTGEAGFLSWKAPTSTAAFVVRKPDLAIVQDWEVTLA